MLKRWVFNARRKEGCESMSLMSVFSFPALLPGFCPWTQLETSTLRSPDEHPFQILDTPMWSNVWKRLLSPALRTALYIVNVNILESQLRLDSVPPMHYHWLRLLCCKQSPVVAQSSFYVNNSLGLCSGRPHGKVLNRKNRTVPPLSGIMIQSKDYTAEEYRGRQTLVWFSAF